MYATPRCWARPMRGSGITLARTRSSSSPRTMVWLQVGNAGTDLVAELLRSESLRVRRFDQEQESALLILALPRRAG